MMKVSDPKIFGHGVTVYYKDVFEKHAETFKKLGIDPDNGLGDVYAKIRSLCRTISARRLKPTSRRSIRNARRWRWW